MRLHRQSWQNAVDKAMKLRFSMKCNALQPIFGEINF